MQSAPVIFQQAPYVVSAQPRSVSIAKTRGLGIVQIILGALSILFGIIAVAVLRYWAGYVGFGIWGGVWILVGGIIGVSSAANPTNTCLNGVNMAFAIVSSCITFIEFIVYCIAVTYYREYYRYCGWNGSYGYNYSCTNKSHTTGVAIYVILVLVMATEFAISLCVAIFCCKYGCQSCCDNATTGVVVQQHQAHIVPSSVIVQSSGVTTSTYPAGYPMSGGMTVPYSAPISYAPQGYAQAYTTAPPGGNPQMAYTTCAGQMQPANPTAMTYSQPGGAEKQQEAGAPPPYQ